MGDEKSCAFCKNNNGIAILLTRHTLMGAAKAEGAVSHGAFKGVTAASGYSFMQKTLRSGYLYVYDENQKKWEAYYISKAGYSAQFDFTKPAPSAIKEKEPCVNIDAHKARGLIITLKNPSKLGVVRFRYSDVEWTEDKKKEYAKLEFRKKYMQSIDIKKWIAGESQGHVPIVTGLTNNVVDFTDAKIKSRMYTKNISGTLLASNEPFINTIKSEVKLVASKETNPRIQNGIILPIDDPVGLAVDIAAYLKNYNVIQRNALTREETVGGILQNLGPAIRQNTEEENLAIAHKHAESYEAGISPITGDYIWLPQKMKEKLTAEPSAADLTRWGKESWAKYEKYISPDKYKAAVTKLGAREQAKRTTPSPLEKCFLSVIKSIFFTDTFIANFDENSPKQGAAYTDTVAAAIADTHENYFCCQYYVSVLSKNFEGNNFLLNALALNQKELKTEIDNLGTKDWRTVPWPKIFSVFNTIGKEHAASSYRALSGLVGNLAGPLLELSLKASTQLNKALVMVGVMSKQPFTYVTVTGSVKEVYKTLTNKVVLSINENNGQVTNTAKIKTQLRLSELHLKNVPNTGKVTVSVLLNDKALASAKTYGQVASITRVGEIKVSSMGAAGLPGLVATISSLLQYAALTKSWENLMEQSAGLSAVFIERLSRLGAGIAGLSAAIGDGIQKSLAAWAKASADRIGAAAVREGSLLARFLATKFFMKTVVAVACLNGAWDIYNGVSKYYQGKKIEGIALGVAGVTGIAAAFAFFFFMPVLGWILAAICITATLIAAFLMDDDLQKWINKSCLGINKEKPYASASEEIKAFEKIFA